MKTVKKAFRSAVNNKEFAVTAKRGYEVVVYNDFENGGTYSVRKPIEDTRVVCRTPKAVIESGAWDIHTRVPARYAAMGVVAIFAKKVGLVKEDYERLMESIQKAKSEAETDEGWQEYIRKHEASNKMEAEYEENINLMKKAMDF